MDSLLNKSRPPVFCPGCSHERIANALDNAFQNMKLEGNQIVIVSDIGCSGLFDTFFHTHAMHGLHGRALTYAAGLKLACPELNVIVTMGDGGLGIGGAHFLSACRRNLDLTLLILNNFNFGMTGGQFSATTPSTAQVGSAFLNQLEKPLDICKVAACAGASYVRRCSSFDKELPAEIEKAIRFNGFSVLDIWGICPGRYTRQNKLTPAMIEEDIRRMTPSAGHVLENIRDEYGKKYRQIAGIQNPAPEPPKIEAKFTVSVTGRQEVVFCGNAGQRIITAGEILCYAGMSAGFNVTQKNEYNITVLRGPSISEVILSYEPVNFTGIDTPAVIAALNSEGAARRKYLFDKASENTLVIKASDVDIPPCRAKIQNIDFKAQKIKSQDYALASLGVLAMLNKVVSPEMLRYALSLRFKEPTFSSAIDIVERIINKT